MKSALLGLAVLVACGAAPARAAAGNPGDTPEYPTRFANTGRSLEALLGAGYRIVSSHLGIDTIGFVLEQNGKWVTCSVRNGDKATADTMLLQCFSMN